MVCLHIGNLHGVILLLALEQYSIGGNMSGSTLTINYSNMGSIEDLRKLCKENKVIFDFRLYDIPNTMRRNVKQCAKWGGYAVTVAGHPYNRDGVKEAIKTGEEYGIKIIMKYTVNEVKDFLESLDISLIDDIDFGYQEDIYDECTVRLKTKNDPDFKKIFSGTRQECSELNAFFQKLCESRSHDVHPFGTDLQSIIKEIYKRSAKEMGYSLEFFMHILDTTPREERDEKFGHIFHKVLSDMTGKSTEELQDSLVRFEQ